MPSSITIALVGISVTYLAARLALHLTHGSQEPPAVGVSVPFLGPIIGMATQKTSFHSNMRDKYKLPIYTLRLPGTRIYVVNATSLITAVQRQFRVINFAPIEVKAAVDIMGASKVSHEILSADLQSDEGYVMSFAKAIHPSTAPGPDLDDMSRRAIKSICTSLDTLSSLSGSIVSLYEWVSTEMLEATTDAVYGPHNPFRREGMTEAWARFEPGIMILALKLFPSLLARKSIQAREALVGAIADYYRAGHWKQGSGLVKARYTHSVEQHKITDLTDMARFELGGAFAILSNTLPAAFWMLFHVYSDPVVLKDCREEVLKIVKQKDGVNVIDVDDVKTSCPVLLSTFREVLRYRFMGVSTRVVMEDTLLDGKYMLKKGSALMIPGKVQHSDTSVWGPTVAEFDHRRFVRQPGSPRPNSIAFRAFGGGHVLCPGRHFASTEVLAFAALAIARLDMAPATGKWVAPKTDNAAMSASLPQPDTDVSVQIERRDEGKWEVVLSGSDVAMEISAEDMQEGSK